jgi:hypothetical protein
MQDHASKQRVTINRALLRLIRPTREEAQSMHGNVRHDGSLDVMGFDHPAHISEVPENQKLFSVRNEDVETLIVLAPSFLKAMRGDYWEIRMAAQFHDLGHYQNYDPRARYLLWMSAIEGLYTSVAEQGSKLAKARISWFLGENTSIYPRGELHDLIKEPNIKPGFPFWHPESQQYASCRLVCGRNLALLTPARHLAAKWVPSAWRQLAP